MAISNFYQSRPRFNYFHARSLFGNLLLTALSMLSKQQSIGQYIIDGGRGVTIDLLNSFRLSRVVG